MADGPDENGLNGLECPSLPGNLLSEDMEYPVCPECERNPGFLTQFSTNSECFECAVCGAKFGDPDRLLTSRTLPRPVRDDFAACVIVGEDPEDQASFRGVPVDEVRSNLETANDLLAQDWVEE